MKESRWALSTKTFGLGLILLCLNFASAGIVIDDFNATRSYPTCCGEYGTYWAFDSNIVQNGSGTLVVGGNATDNGGFYRDKQGEVLWNFTAQSNLVLRAKVLPDNQATNFYLVFRDATGNRALYTFAFSDLNSSNFTALSKPLFTPDWTDGAPFDFTRVISMDIYGEFTEVDSPLRLELDSIETQGPSVIGMLHLDYRTTNGVLVLSWSTNLTNGFLLQSAPTVLGGWGNETNIVIVSNEYRFAVLMTNETRFYRLLATSDPLGTYPVMNEEEFWESLPSPDSLMMRNEANLVMSDARVLTGISQFPPMPPMPPMPDDRLGLSANRAMLSGMQANTMNSGGPPPPSDSVIPTNSYIDVAAYFLDVTKTSFYQNNGSISSDYEDRYSMSYSYHRGGSDHYQALSYTSHVASTSAPYPWVRTNGYELFGEYTTTWDPSSPNWTNGVRIINGCGLFWVGQGCEPETNIVAPTYFKEKFSGIWYGYLSWGTTNAVENASGHFESISRQADMQLELHVGRSFSNNWRTFVLLSNTATRVDAIGLPNAEIYQQYLTQTSPISFSNITVLGETLNADGQRFVQLQPGMVTNVTPIITGASNYTFDLAVKPHHIVNLTRSYHPLFAMSTNSDLSLTNLQGRFNVGSMILAKDDDRKRPDDDISVIYSADPASLYRCDDVPFYIEFRISEGPSNICVLTRTSEAVFPQEFEDKGFFDIRYEPDMFALGSWLGANIKQVNSIYLRIGRDTVRAFGWQTNNPPRMILSEDSPDPYITCVHEWGHISGLSHRNWTENGVNVNPGPEFGGIMSENNPGFPRSEINRDEAAILERFFH